MKTQPFLLERCLGIRNVVADEISRRRDQNDVGVTGPVEEGVDPAGYASLEDLLRGLVDIANFDERMGRVDKRAKLCESKICSQ